MRTWTLPAAAGLAHLALVVACLLVIGHPVPGPGALVGLLVLGAAPVRWWVADRLRSPLVLAVLGLVAAAVLELVTPGPWVTAVGADTLTVGTPVLWSWAIASPLWLAACGLAGLGEASLRRAADRPGWGRSAGAAALVTVLWFAAVALTGLGRSWTASPPATAVYGVAPAAVLVFVAVLLLRRVRLVTPWLVLLVATGVAVAVLWMQAPSGGADAAAGLLDGATVSLALALLLGLAEAAVRGVARLVRRSGAGARVPRPA